MEPQRVKEAARIEVDRRHPVWRDSGAGIEQAIQYRKGFVDGAEWAEDRLTERLEWAMAGWASTKEELTAARTLGRSGMGISSAMREELVRKVEEVLDEVEPMHPQEQSIVRDPSGVAAEVLSVILSAEVLGIDPPSHVSPSGSSPTGMQTRFRDQPPARAGGATQVNWADVKQQLIDNEGQWGLVAENVGGGTVTQLRRGDYKNFRGDELAHFEFISRKPGSPDAPYLPHRTDVWGRYTE